jgi:hypothetical protein
MGAAGVSISQGASALYWNPAGLAASSNLEVRVTHTEWFEGFRHEYAAVSRKWGATGIGFGVLAMYADQLEGYDESGNYEGEFGYYDLAVLLGAGTSINEQFDAGLTAKFIRGSIDEYSATGVAGDVGLKYRPAVEGLVFGASLQNVGMGMTYLNESDPLPAYVQAGGSYSVEGPFPGAVLLSAVDLRKPFDDDVQVHVGLQCLLQSGVSARFGYKGGYENENITTGLGFAMEKISIDYAYVPFSSDLGATHRIAFSYTE